MKHRAQVVKAIWEQFKHEQLLDINSSAVARKPNQYWQGNATWLHANRLWMWPDYLRAHLEA